MAPCWTRPAVESRVAEMAIVGTHINQAQQIHTRRLLRTGLPSLLMLHAVRARCPMAARVPIRRSMLARTRRSGHQVLLEVPSSSAYDSRQWVRTAFDSTTDRHSAERSFLLDRPSEPQLAFPQLDDGRHRQSGNPVVPFSLVLIRCSRRCRSRHRCSLRS